MMSNIALTELTGAKHTGNIKWGVELNGKPIVNSKTADATEALKDLNNYTLSSYETEGGALYQKVREPEVWVIDDELRSPQGVVVEWTDEHGETKMAQMSGLPARIVQHETDHLDGKLFVDYLSPVRREMLMRKVRKRK